MVKAARKTNEVTADETVDAMLEQSGRRDHTPIRIAFLQGRGDNGATPGPLADFVSGHDLGGLLQFLLLLAKASTPPWNAVLPGAVWARALGHPLPLSKAAASAISKTWLRLERRDLITRTRTKRMADVTLLREDGGGDPYTHPGRSGGYFKLPHEFWQSGPNTDQRWYRVLRLPEVAFLLIALSNQPEFRLPTELGPAWYGISADTLLRGASGLEAHGLLTITKTMKRAPLSPTGLTPENRYTLIAPFKHRDSSRRAP